jgi:hypothetical protein
MGTATFRILAGADLLVSIIGMICVWAYLPYPAGPVVGIIVLLQGMFASVILFAVAANGEKLGFIKEYFDIIFVREYMNENRRQCLKCGEMVKPEAKMCRFCGFNFGPPAPKYLTIEALKERSLREHS